MGAGTRITGARTIQAPPTAALGQGFFNIAHGDRPLPGVADKHLFDERPQPLANGLGHLPRIDGSNPAQHFQGFGLGERVVAAGQFNPPLLPSHNRVTCGPRDATIHPY